MKKEFSFYEFVALIVPGSILLYGSALILKLTYEIKVFDFEKFGETVVFLLVCYGVGHLIQAIGNVFEKGLWLIYGSMPTEWLTMPNRFGIKLFKDPFNQKVIDKVQQKFGIGISDYGSLTYNFLFLQSKTSRIDVFNGNYALFRGLSVTFFLLAFTLTYLYDWKIAIPSYLPFILCTRRMIRFGNYYATETFRTFYNLP